uniref:Reverse transcriptase domain-containing protein n=1 Tax=Trichuris muris TaxID=70415 RepID=A0A5S6QRW2_TRIMR
MEDPQEENQQSVPERTAGGDEANDGTASSPGPFKCSVCGFVTTTGHRYGEHVRLHGLVDSYRCSRCGRSFPTINSVASHYGRWCTGLQGPREGNVPLQTASTELPWPCQDCSQRFATHAGRQLHRRTAHTAEFALTQPRELEASLPLDTPNFRDTLEIELFRRYGIRRNLEMIKGQRRKAKYKELVERLRLRGDTGPAPAESLAQNNLAVVDETTDAKDRSVPEENFVLSDIGGSLAPQDQDSSVTTALLSLVERAVRGDDVLDETASAVISFLNVPPPEHQRRQHRVRSPPRAARKPFMRSRRLGKELDIATLDVAKAFDSVSHDSIRRALRSHGASSRSVELVSNLLADSYTTIEHSEGRSDLVPMTCGVKQGDPLSPLLISLVLDELLDELEVVGAGYAFSDDQQLCCLAFAGDILLMSDSKAGYLKYLGVEFNPYGKRRDMLRRVEELLGRVKEAALKSQQKV